MVMTPDAIPFVGRSVRRKHDGWTFHVIRLSAWIGPQGRPVATVDLSCQDCLISIPVAALQRDYEEMRP